MFLKKLSIQLLLILFHMATMPVESFKNISITQFNDSSIFADMALQLQRAIPQHEMNSRDREITLENLKHLLYAQREAIESRFYHVAIREKFNGLLQCEDWKRFENFLNNYSEERRYADLNKNLEEFGSALITRQKNLDWIHRVIVPTAKSEDSRICPLQRSKRWRLYENSYLKLKIEKLERKTKQEAKQKTKQNITKEEADELSKLIQSLLWKVKFLDTLQISPRSFINIKIEAENIAQKLINIQRQCDEIASKEKNIQQHTDETVIFS